MITAKQLFEKSQEQIVTHRKKWEQIGETRQFEFEAYAEWANKLFEAQKTGEKQKDIAALSDICDLADALYYEIGENNNVCEIFNISAERVGIRRRLPDEPDFE